MAERILVCVRPNPESDRLVRAARRMARAAAGRVDRRLRREPGAAAALGGRARAQLGATTASSPSSSAARRPSLSGESVSEALLAFARERNVSKHRGRQARRTARWRDRLQRLAGRRDRAGQRRGRRLHHLRRARRRAPARASGAPGAAAREPLSTSGRRPSSSLCTLVCRAMSRPLRPIQPDHGLPAGRGLRGRRATAAGRRCSPPVLSVAAFDFFFVPPVPHLRRGRHPVRRHLRGDAAGEPRSSAPWRRGCGPRPTRRAARAAHAVLYALSRDLAAARTAGRRSRGRRRRHVAETSSMAGAGRPRAGAARRARLAAAQRGRRATRRRRAVGGPVGVRPRPGGRARHRHAAGRGRRLPPAAGHRSRPSACSGCARTRRCSRCGRTRCDLLEALARQAASGLERARLADGGAAGARSRWRPSGCGARC